MAHLKYLILLLLAGAINAAPAYDEGDGDEKIVITKQVLSKKFLMYTSKYDIVNILVPTNSLNFDENDDVDDIGDVLQKIVLFFVEADVDANNKRVDKGLYVFKGDKATKLLENGRDAAASSDDSKDVFFGAEDGIYVYDYKNNKAVKYGSVYDDIIAIVKENGTDVIYYLNKDHILYKVTEKGEKKVKVDDVVDAQEIVLDAANNLYFYTPDKKVYVINENGVKKIGGLPEHPKTVKLIRPPFAFDDGAILLTDNVFYTVYPNGTSELSQFEIDSNAKPTAFGMDATIIQYFAYEKKIYKYNLLSMMFGKGFEDLKKFLDENESNIQSVSPVNKSSRRMKAH